MGGKFKRDNKEWARKTVFISLKTQTMKINIWIDEEFLESLYSFLYKEGTELPDNFEYYLTEPGPQQTPNDVRANILQVLISFDEYIRLKDH